MLTKDEILRANDARTEEVRVPEWGGSVYVRAMTSLERDKYESEWLRFRENNNGDVKDSTHFRAFLASRVVCDETGTPLFSQADVMALSLKSGAALTRITEAAIRLNGLFGFDEVADQKN
jgi:hypothetical protein